MRSSGLVKVVVSHTRKTLCKTRKYTLQGYIIGIVQLFKFLDIASYMKSILVTLAPQIREA